MKMTLKLSNSWSIVHQFSPFVRTKQVLTMWGKNPTLSPQHKMRLSNSLSHVAYNNNGYKERQATTHKSLTPIPTPTPQLNLDFMPLPPNEMNDSFLER